MILKIMKKILTFVFFFILVNASAADYKSNFTIDKFKQAQNNGKTIVVHSWNKFCYTCSIQKPILEQAQIDFGDVIFLNYEQTKNKDIANFLKISYWTTIVVYKNNKQIAKAIGLNEKNDIYNLIKKGI